MNTFSKLFSIIIFTSLFSNIYASYEYINVSKNNSVVISDEYSGKGSYLEKGFIRKINKKDVKFILEIGSRDTIDAIKLSNFYRCHVFAFECNPEAVSICEHNIQRNPNVTLVKYAAWNKSGLIPFYPVVEGLEGIEPNIGASSCFEFASTSDATKYYKQAKIMVPAIRLDEWIEKNNIPSIDMLCMDAQGATLQILEGLGEHLKNIKYIITEIENQKIYENEALSPEVIDFLAQNGFEYVKGDFCLSFGDFLFIRKDINKKNNTRRDKQHNSWLVEKAKIMESATP